MPLNAEYYRQNADRLWDERWTFVADMNGDGAATLNDVWPWAKWVFFAPGDFIFLVIMSALPELAAFFQLTLSGTGAGVLSLIIWIYLLRLIP